MKQFKKIKENQLFADKWHLIKDICPCDGDVVWFVDCEGALHIGKFNEDVHAFALSDEQGICVEDVCQWKYPGNREIAKYPEDGQTIAFEIKEFNVPALGMYSDRFNNEHGDRFKAVLLPYDEYDFEGEDGEIAIDWEDVLCWYDAPEIEVLRPTDDGVKIGDSVNIANNVGKMEADETLSAAISAAPNTQSDRKDLNSNNDYAPIDDVVMIDSQNNCECEDDNCECEDSIIKSSILMCQRENIKKKKDKLLKEKENRIASRNRRIKEAIKIVPVMFYSNCASYLINKDSSGISDEDIKQCDKFMDIVYEQTGCSQITIPREGEEEYDFGRPSIDGWAVPKVTEDGVEFLSGDLMSYIAFGNIKENPEEDLHESLVKFIIKESVSNNSSNRVKMINSKSNTELVCSLEGLLESKRIKDESKAKELITKYHESRGKMKESYKSFYKRRTSGNMASTLKTIEAKGYSEEEAVELNDKLWRDYNTDIGNYGRGNVPSIQYRLDKIPDKSMETPMDIGD